MLPKMPANSVAVPACHRIGTLAQEHFKVLVEAVTDYAIYMLDLDGFVTTWNAGAERAKGYTGADVIGKHFSLFFTPEDRAGDFPTKALKEAAQTGRYETEGFRCRKDGSRFWTHVVINAIRDHQGKLVGFAKVTRDITERKTHDEALRKSENFLARTGRVAGVGGWELDLLTSEVTWSEETCRIHGVQPDYKPTLEEAINFYAPGARPIIRDAVEKGMIAGVSWDLELPIVRADGRPIWARTVGSVVFEEGRPIRLSGALQDVSVRVAERAALRQARDSLSEQHEMLRVTLQSIADGVVTTGADGRVTYLNPVAEQMTCWSVDEAVGRPMEQVVHLLNEITRAPAENPVMRSLARGETCGLPENTILVARDGTEYGIEDSAAPIRSAEGKLLGAVFVFHDVTMQRSLSGEMNYRASHDPLTGLFNRSEFDLRLLRLLQAVHNTYSENALLYIDLDEFKVVNDTCGHAAGDQLLSQVARIICDCVRDSDMVARLGGDEFAVILNHCPAEGAQRLAQRICDRMDAFRFVHDGRRFRVGASVGLVEIGDQWTTPAAIVQAADISCYAAKEAGRNRVHTWLETDEAMRARRGETQWATRLGSALDDNGFVLFAQRIDSLRGASGVHAEILLRMRGAEGSFLLPGAFLPAAERFHLASRIDRWVLQETIQWMLALPPESRLKMLSVNLSGQSVGDRAFHRASLALLREAGPLICSLICLEITETSAITNLPDAALFIEQAHELGVQIALDDFGSGASSFAYLKALKADFLKIDGQFVRSLVEDRLNEATVRCFVDVARIVGMKTIAEFVESFDVETRLREMGVDFAQGYLIHKPTPINELLIETSAGVGF